MNKHINKHINKQTNKQTNKLICYSHSNTAINNYTNYCRKNLSYFIRINNLYSIIKKGTFSNRLE